MEDQNIEEAVVAAKGSFDLRARLQNRPTVVSEMTLFTDEPTGEKHLDVSKRLDFAEKGTHDGITDPDTGEEILAPKPVDKKLVNRLAKEKQALEAALMETAITLEWRKVPGLFIREARRKAHEKHDVGGHLPESKKEEYNASFIQHLMHRSVTRMTDHASGTVTAGVSVEDAEALQDLLPPSEWERFEAKFANKQYMASIEFDATDNPDF